MFIIIPARRLWSIARERKTLPLQITSDVLANPIMEMTVHVRI